MNFSKLNILHIPIIDYRVHKSHEHVYTTALEDFQSIGFTHGVWMGGRLAGKVCLGCISKTVRCTKLILGRDIS